MREILFRGQTGFERKWIEGYYSKEPYDDGFIDVIVQDTGEWNEIYPETLCEYTGIYDKNGVRVFEGDILKISRRSDALGTYYFPDVPYPCDVVVRWDHCAWTWETLTESKRYITFPDAWCHYVCEVIGNIHDKGGEEK